MAEVSPVAYLQAGRGGAGLVVAGLPAVARPDEQVRVRAAGPTVAVGESSVSLLDSPPHPH